MKVALFSDIHGNYVAFRETLKDLNSRSVDKIICLGDVVAFGPEPVQCMDALMELGCPVVMGNTDDWVFGEHPFKSSEGLGSINADRIEWLRLQLSKDQRDYIKQFSPTITVKLPAGQNLLCFHGSPESYNDIIMPETSEGDLAKFINGYDADYFAGGHTHLRMLRRVRGRTFINTGSVGLPFLTSPMDDPWRIAPYAEYAILEISEESSTVQFAQVPLDVDEVMRSAEITDFPHKERWIEGWQLGRQFMMEASA